MTSGPYLVVRLVLWVMSVGIAAVPAVAAAGGLSLDYVGELAAIDAAHAFRDAAFVLVPAAALGLSSVADYWCRAPQLSQLTRALTIIAIIGNMLALVAGAVGFVAIPAGAKAGIGLFSTYCYIIAIGLIFSLLTEIGIAVAHGNHAKRHPH